LKAKGGGEGRPLTEKKKKSCSGEVCHWKSNSPVFCPREKSVRQGDHLRVKGGHIGAEGGTYMWGD